MLLGMLSRLESVGVPFNCLARNGGEILARVEQTLSRRVPAIAATFRSALTEFAPALRCHYPGQAGILKADPKTYAVLVLRSVRDFLLRSASSAPC